MKKFLPLLVLPCLIILGCGNDDGGDSGSNPTSGAIVGSVNLFDDKTNSTDADGMTVTVVGTSLSDITDSQGNFRIENVPFGEVVLEYTKSGYGTFRSASIDHQGNDDGNTFVTSSPSLGQVSTTSITQASATFSGNDLEVTVNTDPAGNSSNAVYVTIFLSSSNAVSNTENEGVFGPRDIRINPVDITISASELAGFGFTSGQTIFIKVYGDSFFSNSYDGTNGQVHPNVSATASTTLSVMIP